MARNVQRPVDLVRDPQAALARIAAEAMGVWAAILAGGTGLSRRQWREAMHEAVDRGITLAERAARWRR
jgi:uncharacterized NAD-dependent epimerase/dehydratase family protein